MVLFYTLPTSVEVSVFSSTKSWQKLEGLREGNNPVNLEIRLKSLEHRGCLFFAFPS